MTPGRSRVFVRVRISGIFRISFRPTCAFRITLNHAKTNMDERSPAEDNPWRVGIARLRATLTASAAWIPAFAGMTGREREGRGRKRE